MLGETLNIGAILYLLDNPQSAEQSAYCKLLQQVEHLTFQAV